ncbi:MAG: shikimate dehydrogenase [Victivallaceae bacterium]|nr:shikimate dehydrogenase [Victivallaceae bacterium]
MTFSLEQGIRYVVIGNPVAHSLSPEMQNAGFAALGMSERYGKLQVTAEEFPEFIAFARRNLAGFNITVPHKKRIIPYLDRITDPARRADSVNTVSVKSGKLCGSSTDGYGLETALREAFDFEPPGGKIAFIGCGGAVQAAAFHLAARGAAALYFANRTLGKAEILAARISENYPGCECRCCTLTAGETLKTFFSRSAVVIQGTSLGLKDEDPTPIDPAWLRGSDFYETIYRETPLLRAARQAGLRVADGRTMLLHQGAEAFALWTGRAAPLEAMRRALYAAIERRRQEEK